MRRRATLPNTVLLSMLILGVGCTPDFDEASIREFVDTADAAYLDGKVGTICDMRSEDFRQETVTFDLTGGEIVADASEAEELAAAREAEGDPIAGKTAAMDLRSFCRMVLEERRQYPRVAMTRGDLSIELDTATQQATVRAHYSIKLPVYGEGLGPLGYDDSVEVQTATRQVEVDDESVVGLRDGKLRFLSTRAVQRMFLIEKEVHDERL
jgi:hypothetical protein